MRISQNLLPNAGTYIELRGQWFCNVSHRSKRRWAAELSGLSLPHCSCSLTINSFHLASIWLPKCFRKLSLSQGPWPCGTFLEGSRGPNARGFRVQAPFPSVLSQACRDVLETRGCPLVFCCAWANAQSSERLHTSFASQALLTALHAFANGPTVPCLSEHFLQEYFAAETGGTAASRKGSEPPTALLWTSSVFVQAGWHLPHLKIRIASSLRPFQW